MFSTKSMGPALGTSMNILTKSVGTFLGTLLLILDILHDLGIL